jgi:hypothetical protein
MTNAVIAGKAAGESSDPVKGSISLREYLEKALRN